MMNLLSPILILLGTISLVIGLVGIVVPGLPTTPFLLLTAGLYLKGSKKLHQKLINNPYVGKYILDYQSRKGLTKKQKTYALSMMWTMIFLSTYFFMDSNLLRMVTIGVGFIGTYVVGFVIKTVSP